jgi:Ca2+-binding RTX toxin-like protein
MRTPKSRRRRALMIVSGAALVAVTGLGPAAAVIIDGTPDDDVLRGTINRDQIDGLAGNDDITGLGGNDILWGREGADVIRAGNGEDRLDGGPGDDVTYGSFGRDQFYSFHLGTDRMYAGAQDDFARLNLGYSIIQGGPGIDLFTADGQATAQMYGDGGDDMLQTQDAAVGMLDGGAGNDRLWLYSTSASTVHGGIGDDEVEVYGMSGGVWADDGNDSIVLVDWAGGRSTGPLDGGAGDDLIHSQTGAADMVRCGPGYDTARIDLEDTVVDCEVIEHLISGDNYADTLIGSAYDDIIEGFAGDDFLSGRAGDDLLYPDLGEDTVRAGIGDDTITAANANEPVEADLVFCGDGVDTVYADDADTVSADCENVVLVGPARIRR